VLLPQMNCENSVCTKDAPKRKKCTKKLLVNDLSEAQRQLRGKSAFQRLKSMPAGTSDAHSQTQKQPEKPANTAFSGIKMSQRTNTSIVSILCDIVGGGGGSRTRVRKLIHQDFSGCIRSFAFPRRSADRQAIRLGIHLVHQRCGGSSRWRSPLVDALIRAAVLPVRTAA